jgi:hypothetical protein
MQWRLPPAADGWVFCPADRRFLLLDEEPIPMPNINKPLLRLASAIHSQLALYHHRARPFELPNYSWDRCVELERQSRRAETRSWHLAAEELRRNLGYTITTLQAEVAAIGSQLPLLSTAKTMATTGDIYADLLVL